MTKEEEFIKEAADRAEEILEKEKEISDKLERILGRERYIEIFFSDNEKYLLKIKAKEEKSLKNFKRKHQKTDKDLSLNILEDKYNSLKYLPRFKWINKKGAEKILSSAPLTEEQKNKLIYNLNKDKICINYKEWIYQKAISEFKRAKNE